MATEITTSTEQVATILNEINQAASILRTRLDEARQAASKQAADMENGRMVNMQFVTSPALQAAEYQTKVQTLVNVATMLGATQEQVQAAYTTTGLFWARVAS